MGTARESICEAMLQLMEQKPFDQIKVRDIVERAGVNRGSYYYHFSDPAEIVRAMMEEFVEGLGRIYGEWAAQGSRDQEKIQRGTQGMERVYEFTLENQRLYRALMASPFCDEFAKEQVRCIMEALEPFSVIIKDGEGRRYVMPQREKEFYISKVAYRYLSMVHVWRAHDFEESPQEMSILTVYQYYLTYEEMMPKGAPEQEGVERPVPWEKALRSDARFEEALQRAEEKT